MGAVIPGLTFGQPLFTELGQLQRNLNKAVVQVQGREAEGQQRTLALCQLACACSEDSSAA